jgi:hypothetical protein
LVPIRLGADPKRPALEYSEVVMITVTVHEPPSPPADRLDRADRLAFVKDGYNWLAAIWPPLWMLAQRLWLALLAYVVIAAVLSLGLPALGLPAAVTGLVFLGCHLLIGLEADSIMRWNLDRSGWQVVGTVVGHNLAECERRFFDDWLPQQPIIRVHGLAGADGRRAQADQTRDDPRAGRVGSGNGNGGNGGAGTSLPATGWRRLLGGWSSSAPELPKDLSKMPAERG